MKYKIVDNSAQTDWKYMVIVAVVAIVAIVAVVMNTGKGV